MTTHDLLRRVAAAEAQAHARMAAGGAVGRFGSLVALALGPDANGQPLPVDTAWHDGSAVPTPDDLQAFEAFSARHGQSATLHLLSHAAPPLLPLLGARGYRLDFVLHLYTHDLQTLPLQPPADIRDAPDAALWARVAAAGFGPGTERIMEVVGQTAGKRLFLAYGGGQPVASAAYSVEDGVAALHGTSTLPEHRGRGLQTALLAHRLRAAAGEGADLATVFVTPGSGSERNVERAGFRLSGMRLTLTRR